MKILTLYKQQKSDTIRNCLSDITHEAVVMHTLDDAYIDFVSASRPGTIVLDFLDDSVHENDTHIVRSIRAVCDVPIFMVLPSPTQASYRELMFDAGVDGCVQSPFLPEEFSIRFKTLISKTTTPLFSGTTIKAGDICIDLASHTVCRGNDTLNFTKTEYGIFLHLMLHRNVIVPPDILTQYIRFNIDVLSTALNVHILNIRKKLGDLNIIHTAPRQGFYVS